MCTSIRKCTLSQTPISTAGLAKCQFIYYYSRPLRLMRVHAITRWYNNNAVCTLYAYTYTSHPHWVQRIIILIKCNLLRALNATSNPLPTDTHAYTHTPYYLGNILRQLLGHLYLPLRYTKQLYRRHGIRIRTLYFVLPSLYSSYHNDV